MSVPSTLLERGPRRAARRSTATCSAGRSCRPRPSTARSSCSACTPIEQFVFLIADDQPMTCPRLDHYGLSVGDRGRARRRARARRRRSQARDDRVDIIDKKIDDHGMLAITSIYVRLPAADDGRDPVVGLQVERRDGATVCAGARSSRRAGSSSTPAGARPTRGRGRSSSRSSPSAPATTTSGCTTTSRRCRAARPTHCFEAFTMLAALSQVTERGRARPARHVRGYRNAGLLAKEAAVRRRVLGRPAHPRPRRRLVRARVPGVRLRVPERPRAAARARRDAAGDPARCGPTRPSTFDGTYVQLRRRVLRPEAGAAPRPPIWVGGGGEQVTLRIAARARRRDQLAGRARRVRAQVGGAREALRRGSGRDFESIVRTHGPDCRLFDSEPTCERGSTRPTADSCGAGATPTSTSATTSSAPSSRSPRRSRRSSTPAARSSCSGSATSRRARAWSASRAEVVPERFT